MIRLAQIWPTLTNKWMEIEYVFGHQKNLRRTFLTISILVTVLYLGRFFVDFNAKLMS